MAKQDRTTKPRRERPYPITIRSGQPFRDWLTAFAHDQKISVAEIFDRGVAELAKSLNYPPPPSRSANK